MADSFVPVTFVADELLTSTKMNLLAANQAGFHDGTALGDGIIVTRHLGSAAIESSAINLINLTQALVQKANYSIPVRSMTAWTYYNDGSATFTLIAGRRYKVEANGNVPGTMTNVEHMLRAEVGGVGLSVASVSSIGGNASFAGFATFTATTTGTASISLQNRISGSGTGTAQTIEIILTMIG